MLAPISFPHLPGRVPVAGAIKVSARVAFLIGYGLFLLAAWNVSSIFVPVGLMPSFGWRTGAPRFYFIRHSFEFVSVTLPILGMLLRAGWETRTDKAQKTFPVALAILVGPCLVAVWSHYGRFTGLEWMGQLSYSSLYFLSLGLLPYVRRRWSPVWVIGVICAVLAGIYCYDMRLTPRGVSSWSGVALLMWACAAFGRDNRRPLRFFAAAGGLSVLLVTALLLPSLRGPFPGNRRFLPVKERALLNHLHARLQPRYLGVNWLKSEDKGFHPALVYAVNLDWEEWKADWLTLHLATSFNKPPKVREVRCLTTLHPSQKETRGILVIDTLPGFSTAEPFKLKLHLYARRQVGSFDAPSLTWPGQNAVYQVSHLGLTILPTSATGRTLRFTAYLSELSPNLPKWIYGSTQIAGPSVGVSCLVLHPRSGLWFGGYPYIGTDGWARRNHFSTHAGGSVRSDLKRSHASERAMSRYNAVELPEDQMGDPQQWMAEAKVGIFQLAHKSPSIDLELTLPPSLPLQPGGQ